MLAFARGGQGVRRDPAAIADREHDLLIVGGGIYGAAAAWDAAQRGLRVALVEKGDFGGGTSWNSLKTIHGGLRHLQRLELGLLRESVRERRAFLRIAPALVRPQPFLVPAYGHGPRGALALGVGVWLFDRLAWDRNRGLGDTEHIPGSRMLSPAEVCARVPGVAQAGLTGGALWSDAQALNSERLLLAFLHAASDAGALLANAAEVTGLERAGARIVGARVRDHESGDELVVRARSVLNAAGPGVDGVLRRAGIERPRVPLLRASNLVLRRPPPAALAVGAQAGGRYLFLVPWRGRAIVGTDYEAADRPGDPERQRRFLADAQAAFPWAGLEAADVVFVHMGLVPGCGGAPGLWSHSRVIDHEREDRVAGLVSVVGAKYTTARSVAERALDLVCARLGRAAAACRTALTPLPRAVPAQGSLEEQVAVAVREEMALHLSDVVLRRSELFALGPPRADDIQRAAVTMSRELGWDADRSEAERATLAHALRAHEPRLG